MLATRERVSFPAEWITAVVFLAATVLVGGLILRELRAVPQAFISSADRISAIPAVPPEAVLVPTLVLGENLEIRVGDAADTALARVMGVARLTAEQNERGPLGARQIRSYKLGSTNFIVVAEPFERGGATKVSAIYLQ
jgi:hypothetical protein